MAATSDVTENSEEKNSVEVVDLETEVSSQPNNTVKLEDLKVTELKSELEKRDLDKNGVKSVLIERLKAAIIEEGGDPDNYVNDLSSDSCVNKSLPPKETSEAVETNGNAEPNDKLDSSNNKLDSSNDNDKLDSSNDNDKLDSSNDNDKLDSSNDNDKLDSSNDNDKLDSSNMLDEKVDVPLQLLIDEEEAQLNDDDGLMEPEPPKEPEIESKLDESIQEQETPKSSKKNESAKTAKKPRSSMILLSSLMNTKTANKDVKEKKVVKTTVQKKTTEATSTLSPRVLKVIGKSDKLKSPTVLAKSLWITNLPDNTRAADLKALFGKQGRVLSVKIVKSAKQTPGKCYGFVTMATSKDATRAVENLNHTELNGRKISVEKTQNEPGTLIKKSESKVLTFTAKKQTIRKEATTPKQSLPVQKDSKPVSKEASKDKSTEGTKSSTEESRKKDNKVSSAEKAKKEKERRSREHDRERDLHRSVRRPIFKSRPFGFDRSRYGGYKQPFGSRPFSNRVGFGSSFKPRPNLLALQKLRDERFFRDRERETREAERRRADERHRFIERKQREEAYRLEREKERLRMEREILDRERAEILRLEREKQRLERERLEREREELRRQAEIRRSTKRPFSRIEREPEPIWDDRKKLITKYDSRASFHPPPPSSSSSRYEYLPRERSSFSREFDRHPEKFGAPKQLDVLHRADFDREARREVTIRTRDERQVFSRSEFRERDNRRSFSSRERERHSSSRRENPREDWKHVRRVHERIIPGPSSSTQRRMTYY